MLFFTLGFNLGITLLNCYLVWRLRRLRRSLIRMTQFLNYLQARSDRVLSSAPSALVAIADNSSGLKHGYGHLRKQLQNLQPLFLVVSLSRRYWRKQKKYGKF